MDKTDRKENIMAPEYIRVGAAYCTSKREYIVDPKRWEIFAEERLMKEISFLLARERSQRIDLDDRVERRIDLYVASPDTFWRIVREEAEKIARQFWGK
ncbi:MAG: hypothetical protein WC451_06720 [Patescibacteria group bacterium]